MIKNFLEYIKESMTTDVDGLLSSINDKKGDFFTIHLSNDEYMHKPIELLYDDANFNKQLFKDHLKKGEMETTGLLKMLVFILVKTNYLLFH